MLDLCNCCAM